MKAGFKYQIYPTAQQKTALDWLVGCASVVCNDTLAFCNEHRHQPIQQNIHSSEEVLLKMGVEGRVRLLQKLAPS